MSKLPQMQKEARFNIAALRKLLANYAKQTKKTTQQYARSAKDTARRYADTATDTIKQHPHIATGVGAGAGALTGANLVSALRAKGGGQFSGIDRATAEQLGLGDYRDNARGLSNTAKALIGSIPILGTGIAMSRERDLLNRRGFTADPAFQGDFLDNIRFISRETRGPGMSSDQAKETAMNSLLAHQGKTYSEDLGVAVPKGSQEKLEAYFNLPYLFRNNRNLNEMFPQPEAAGGSLMDRFKDLFSRNTEGEKEASDQNQSTIGDLILQELS